jgi:rhodanese-related sulfurtransferase
MRTSLHAPIRAFAAFAFVAAVVSVGCMGDMDGMETLSVSELGDMLVEQPETVVLDANGDSIRDNYGVIPGATLLSSASSYDTAAELPDSKSNPLVFYCSSKMCSAAPSAARRARDAGYTSVYVLPAGIKGWVQAGRPNAKPRG